MPTRNTTATWAAVSILALSAGSVGMVRAEPEPAHDFSANVAMTTNYVFRGVSQTDNGPAIQGGFDYDYHPYSLYAGVWASNVDSGPDGYNDAGMELDIYAGWAPSWEGLGLDLGYIRYQYPKTDTADNNTDEYHLGISYEVEGFVPGYTAHYSDDYFGGGSAWYHDLSIEIPLPYEFILTGHYGWNQFDDSSTDYDDYSAGLSREFMGFGFELSWIDHSEEETCASPFQCGDLGVFTLSKSF